MKYNYILCEKCFDDDFSPIGLYSSKEKAIESYNDCLNCSVHPFTEFAIFKVGLNKCFIRLSTLEKIK